MARRYRGQAEVYAGYMGRGSHGKRLNGAQIAALVGCAAVFIWSVAGLIVNPDFAIGSSTTSKLVLGVDMNGWHALSGFLVIVPVLIALGNEQLLGWVQGAAGLALYLTAIWTFLSEYPAAGLFYFPHPVGDIVLHLVVGTIFMVGAALAWQDAASAEL